MVMSCERPLDMWNLSGRVLQAEQLDPSLKGKLKFGIYKEGQVMLGNQMAVLKGGPNPNAGKLFVEFMLSKEGADVYVADEILYSFRSNYTAPEEAQPYLFDLNKEKLVGMDDWVAAQLDFAETRRPTSSKESSIRLVCGPRRKAWPTDFYRRFDLYLTLTC